LLTKGKIEEHVSLIPEIGEYYDTLLERPILLLSGVAYQALHERLFDILSTGAITLLYEFGCQLGKSVAEKLKTKYPNPIKIFSAGISHYFFLGTGKIDINPTQLLRMATLNRMKIRIKDNFFALALGKTGQAECHITRGYLASGAEVLTGKKWTCDEIKCLCKGDPYCEFELKKANASPH